MRDTSCRHGSISKGLALVNPDKTYQSMGIRHGSLPIVPAPVWLRPPTPINSNKAIDEFVSQLVLRMPGHARVPHLHAGVSHLFFLLIA